MSVFVDTSALYALLVRTEERHSDIVAAFRDALEDGQTMWTTSYAVVETIALLQHRFGLAPVRDLVQHLIPALSVDWVSGVLHRKGLERLLKEDRRQLSLVDCVSMEFMRQEGVRDVLALDPHFAEAGFRLLPSAGKG